MKNKAVLFAFFLVLTGCDSLFLGDINDPVTLNENLATPPSLSDGWETTALEDVSIQHNKIRSLIKRRSIDPSHFHSLLIAKNGKLAVEAYFGGWHRERLQSIRSASKSVTSILVGIATDNGFIESVDEPIFNFFPDYAMFNSVEKNEIRLHHVLSMTAGLKWSQGTGRHRDDEDRLSESEDGFAYILEKPLVATPGTRFNYSSGCSDLLAGVIRHSTGLHADRFAEEKLFKPLSIKRYGWRKQLNGYPNAGYGLHLLPRDMLKIGQLFLDSGAWNGTQIVSKEWVRQSTKDHDPGTGQIIGYGYQWWLRTWAIKNDQNVEVEIRTYQAQGNGGQIICVIPQWDVAFVLTGSFYDEDAPVPYNFIQSTLLPALRP